MHNTPPWNNIQNLQKFMFWLTFNNALSLNNTKMSKCYPVSNQTAWKLSVQNDLILLLILPTYNLIIMGEEGTLSVKIYFVSLLAKLCKTFLNHDHIFMHLTLILPAECVFSCSSGFGIISCQLQILLFCNKWDFQYLLTIFYNKNKAKLTK